MSIPQHIRQKRMRVSAQHRSWLKAMAFDSLAGAAIGSIVALAILWLDVANLGTLVASSQQGFAYAALLTAGFAHVFAMAVCGTGIWFRATQQPELHEYPSER